MRKLLLALMLLFLAAPVAAQDTTAEHMLTLTWPRAGLPSGHRIYKAYTGIPYEIPVAAVGGCFPFTYSMSNAPSGATITPYIYRTEQGTTGSYAIVSWPNPTSTATSWQFTVTDNCSVADSETITVTVGTSGFIFVDSLSGNAAPSNGGTGAGTLANPYLTLNDVFENNVAGAYVYLYPRTASNPYNFSGVTQSGVCIFDTQPELRVEVNESTGFSGIMRWPISGTDAAVINYGYDGSFNSCADNVPYLRLNGHGKAWFDGLTLTNIFTKGIEHRHNSDFVGGVFWRNTATTYGPGRAGANSAVWMTASTGGQDKFGGLILANVGTGGAGISGHTTDFSKTYDEDMLLIADNAVSGMTGVGDNDGQFSVKGNHTRVEVRTNKCTGMADGQTCYGGNNSSYNGYELRYNLAIVQGVQTSGAAAVALMLNQGPGSPCTDLDARRNTFIGRIWVRSNASCSAPVVFALNVVINEDQAQTNPHFCTGESGTTGWGTCNNTNVPALTLSNNLTVQAAAGAVDANGNLQGSYLTDHGPNSATPKGHMLSSSSSTPKRFRGFVFD